MQMFENTIGGLELSEKLSSTVNMDAPADLSVFFAQKVSFVFHIV